VTVRRLPAVALPAVALAASALLLLAGCTAAPAAHRGEGDLATPRNRDIAMQLVSSAENSSLDWRAQYGYLEDIGDDRGYTGGLVGFTSATGDMLRLVEDYTRAEPANPLAPFLAALRAVNGSASHDGLGDAFETAWAAAATDPAFRTAQDDLVDEMYFDPAVARAKKDGLGALGQFVYFDAIVMHGPGTTHDSFGGIRATAMRHARTPAQGGDETTYLDAFLDARVDVMREEAAHDDVSRVSTEQRAFLRAGNLGLRPPLRWSTYGDGYEIR
jgi:chitosanase